MPHWLYSHLPDRAPAGTSNPRYRLDGTPVPAGAEDPEPAPRAEEE